MKIIVVIESLYLDLTLSVWILTENKIAPTQDLEELYSLYKHERDDRIMLREESGQLSPELRLKVHLSKTHNTDSSDLILISVLLFPHFLYKWRKEYNFHETEIKLSISEFYDLGAWKFLILLNCIFRKITPWHLTLNAFLLTTKFTIFKLFSK